MRGTKPATASPAFSKRRLSALLKVALSRTN
jgi:hypothetical protein